MIVIIPFEISVDDVADTETEDADAGTDEYAQQSVDQKETAI